MTFELRIAFDELQRAKKTRRPCENVIGMSKHQRFIAASAGHEPNENCPPNIKGNKGEEKKGGSFSGTGGQRGEGATGPARLRQQGQLRGN